jgi:hypothetical protein
VLYEIEYPSETHFVICDYIYYYYRLEFLLEEVVGALETVAAAAT